MVGAISNCEVVFARSLSLLLWRSAVFELADFFGQAFDRLFRKEPLTQRQIIRAGYRSSGQKLGHLGGLKMLQQDRHGFTEDGLLLQGFGIHVCSLSLRTKSTGFRTDNGPA